MTRMPPITRSTPHMTRHDPETSRMRQELASRASQFVATLAPRLKTGARLLRQQAPSRPIVDPRSSGPGSTGARWSRKAPVSGAVSTADASHWVPLERRLLQRVTMGWTQADVATLDEVGYEAYLEAQLDFEAIDTSPLESVLEEFLPSIHMQPYELLLNYEDSPHIPLGELQAAAIVRSLYSPRQLFERMVVFWTDHFNIDILSDLGPYLKPTDDRDVIRRHAMGKFPDLLAASSKSPAMLNYLTNDTNNKEHPNENYAREVMELHTLGADNGYTQEDVREVARCLTGWTFWGLDGGSQVGTFLFDPRAHDFGSKVVLGQPIPAHGGIEDGETVMEILAQRPETARFISRKLARYLWGYEPPDELIDSVAQEYEATGGDIRAMLGIILSPFWLGQSTVKFKRPYHLIISALRSLGADADLRFVWDALFTMGHLPFGWTRPDGYPDTQEYWSGFLLPRWDFADGLSREESGVAFDLPLLDPSNPDAVTQPADMVAVIDWLLFDSTLSAEHRASLLTFLEGGAMDQKRILETLGLAVASPEFQLY